MADITNDIAALRAALPGLKGWGLERVEPCPEDDGQAEVGTSFDDGGFAPVITVDTGLYYANDRAMPLARAVSVACVAAPALLAELDRLTAALQAAQAEAAALRAQVADLQAAEEGAKVAFGHVVQDKRSLKADCRRLHRLLDSAHDQIRRNAIAAREVKHG